MSDETEEIGSEVGLTCSNIMQVNVKKIVQVSIKKIVQSNRQKVSFILIHDENARLVDICLNI